MTTINVATTVNPYFDHVAEIEAQQSHVMISHQCQSLPEILAIARTGLVDIVLLTSDVEQIGPGFLDRLNDSSTRNIKCAVLTDIAAERKRLNDAGIAAASPEIRGTELVQWLTDILNEDRLGAFVSKPREKSDETVFTADDLSFLQQLESGEESVRQEPYVLEESQQLIDHSTEVSNSRVTAVWGPIGSPGRSTVAMNLAAESAQQGYRTLLIDADTFGACQALMWGLMDDSAAIAQLSRKAESKTLDVQTCQDLTARVQVGRSTLDLLTGLTRADRWPEIRKGAFERILNTTRQGWDHIVIDCGFGLEEDEELSFDIPAPQRHATTLAAIAHADTILAIGVGDPIGIPRLVKGLDDLKSKPTEARIVPVINKISRLSAGNSPKQQVKQVWVEFGSTEELRHFLAFDPDACSQALLTARPLSEQAPKSQLRVDVQQLLLECSLPALNEAESQQANSAKSPAKTRREYRFPKLRGRKLSGLQVMEKPAEDIQELTPESPPMTRREARARARYGAR